MEQEIKKARLKLIKLRKKLSQRTTSRKLDRDWKEFVEHENKKEWW